ncbi:PREDICTED: uncharacterized protein LOC109227700 [Nicotiana attenuata]|uniref:C2H2-type domain-containing protein n=1 Tax=Nicotiana attenuata TaxID=49451 RepID=A0A1J6IBC4_NICAT|nr:PREDICTED: uncharacterized protein LOC109227700 [Nicotiana attenuata]OIT01874.1 hypothetical protein A4A49_21002 [Nicotiana attenuata]
MVDKQEHRSILKGRGIGTLWVKVKIPKEEQVIEDHDYKDEDKVQIQRKNNTPSRNICHVCNKGFSSGKALGGHMRIHAQPAANKGIKKRKGLLDQPIPLFNKRKLQMKQQEVDILRKKKMGRNQRPPITCSICGKKFASKKSLFGHMRCHPDRDWRGIHPPPTDLSKAVGSWSVTAKRGRRTNSSSSSSEEEQLRDGVHYLMLLAHGHSLKDTGKLETMNSNYKTADEADHLVSITKKSTICRPIKKRMKKLKDLGSIQDVSIYNTVISTAATSSSTNNITTTMDDHEPQLSSSSQISCVRNNNTSSRILDFDLNELPLPS